MKATQEITTIFWEDNRPVGMLHQNGTTEFFKVSKASKDFVSELLGVNQVKE